MIVLSVAKLKTFTPQSEISLGIKQNKNVFVESLDQFRSLEVREKVRIFCDWPASVWPLGITQRRIFIKFSLFRSYFVLPNFWSLRNLIKQLFHSRLLDMRLVIANSALRWLFTISYPMRAQGIIVNYSTINETNFTCIMEREMTNEYVNSCKEK